MKQNKVPKNEYTKGEPSPYRKNPFREDVFYGDAGQYAHKGQVTRIPGDAFGTHITMKGINEPLYARDDQGNEQMMYPGMDYQFPGQYVTEYPQMQTGGSKMYDKKADYEASKKQQRIAPISVTDPNDPRLKSYNDSSALYKSTDYLLSHPLTGDYVPGKEYFKNSKINTDSDNKRIGVKEDLRTGYVNLYKKPVQPYTLKKEEIVPQETAEYLPQRQIPFPTQQQEPELRIPTTPKDTTAGKRIAWRQDPNTKKMVPVIGGMKESVKNMKRLYNKDIPSSTGAIPADFNPDYGDVATFQNGGWLDELDEEYRRGGMVNPLMKSRSKRSGTSKNIQSSINKIFLRNHDIFGPGGKNIYNPKSKYQDGGLRAVGTTGAIPVSTQAPINPTNATNLDWVAEKWKNRDQGPSDWNFAMMDKSGSYVDSGIDPFTALLSAPQQVIKTVSTTLPKTVKAIGEKFKSLKGLTKGANKSVSNIKDKVIYPSQTGVPLDPNLEPYISKRVPDLKDIYEEGLSAADLQKKYADNIVHFDRQGNTADFNKEMQYIQDQMHYGKKPLLKNKDIGTNKEYDQYLESVADWRKKTGQPEEDMFSFFNKNKEEIGDPEMMKIFPKPEPKSFYLNDDAKMPAYKAARGVNEKEVPEAVKYFNNPQDQQVVQWMKTGDAKEVIKEMAPRKYKNLDNMSPQQLEKARLEVHDDFINGWKKNFKERLKSNYTGKEAFQQLTPNKYGGQQKGWLDDLH